MRVLADAATTGSLDALALDTLALLEARWRQVADALGRRFPESELGDIAPEELSALPGIQEVLGLHEVGELARCGQWDHMVVDCASTADAMRMLTLPSTFALYVERAWPRHRRLSAGADDVRSTAVVELLERIAGSVEKLSALLTDGTRVGAHLVLTAERVVAAEAIRTLGSLALMGVRVDELIVNQILMQDDSYEYRNLPDHPAFDWYSERITEQRTVLDELDATIGDVALVLAPHLAGEPIGAKALAELLDSARRRDGSAPPGPLRPVVDLESGSGLESVYRMRLELPQSRVRRADPWPGRRRPDHRRRRDAAQSSAGVRPAAVHGDGRAASRQRTDGAFSTRSGGVAEMTGPHPDIGPGVAQARAENSGPDRPGGAAGRGARRRRRRGHRQLPAGVVPGVRAGRGGDR